MGKMCVFSFKFKGKIQKLLTEMGGDGIIVLLYRTKRSGFAYSLRVNGKVCENK